MRKTTEQFIKEAKEKHGDKFDYSKTVFTKWDENVIITCPIHGDFEVKPYNHLRSKFGGCKECNDKKQLTTEQFVKQAIAKYGDKYDYSKAIIKNTFTRTTIICPKHGEFKRFPKNFLKGNGCSGCHDRTDKSVDPEILRENFIKKANKKHGDKYDYSKVDIEKEKITIICKKHGEFKEKPKYHLAGNGCPICGLEERAKSQAKTTEQFIEEAKKIHGDKYDYSKVDYKNNKEEVIVICPEHGEFLIIPVKLLEGQGCPKHVGRDRTTEEAIADIERKYPGVYDFSKFNYVNAATKSILVCKKHNQIVECSYKELMSFDRKCCRKEWQSKPNLYIKELLDGLGIKSLPEHTFTDCRYKNKLPFDFYLPDYNTVIEYQGEWHYFDFKGGMEIQQIRDKIKRNYCRENGIKEIEIPYWELDNIEEIIKENLCQKP